MKKSPRRTVEFSLPGVDKILPVRFFSILARNFVFDEFP
jgi:hypothetical protein